MARKKADKPLSEQDQILDAEVRLDGQGEPEAVKAMLSPDFAGKKDSEALDIVNALREIIRGQKFQEEELAKMRQRMVEREEDERRWREDQEKFIQETIDKADRTRKATGEKKDQIIANATKLYQECHQRAKAEIATKRVEFMQRCERAPKVMVASAGKRYLVRQGDSQVWRTEPEEFIMEGVRFVLKPNEINYLPDFVAEEYFRVQRQKGRLDKLGEQLQKQEEFGKAVQIAPEISPDYNPQATLNTYQAGEGIFQTG